MPIVADRSALKAHYSSPTSPGNYLAVGCRKRDIIDYTTFYRDLWHRRRLKSPGMLRRFDWKALSPLKRR